MNKSSSNKQLHAIVVGNSTDEFVRHTIDLLTDYDVEFVRSDDVYLAVGRMAKNASANGLVIGRLEKLAGEQGQFFHIANKNGFSCCCLADGNVTQNQITAAAETAAFLINEPAQLAELLTRLLSGSLGSSLKENQQTSAFIKNEPLLTQAELDALLGI